MTWPNARLACTPLHISGMRGQLDAMKALLRHGADITAKIRLWLELNVKFLAHNDNPGTPYQCLEQGCLVAALAAENRIEVMQHLIEAGADVNARDCENGTLLHVAAEFGHATCITVLIEAGADVNVLRVTGQTPISVAVESGHDDCARILAARGADLDKPDKPAFTPLGHTIQSENLRIVQTLLDHGAADSLCCGFIHAYAKVRVTPLMLAYHLGRVKIVGTLVNNGVDVNAFGEPGWTALFLAARYSLEITELLVSAGADVNPSVTDYIIILMQSLQRPDIAAYLIEAGACIDTRDSTGFTALHHAVTAGSDSIVELLVKNGANLEAKNDNGETPLHRAVLSSKKGTFTDLIVHLLEAGADPRVKTRKGHTPYDLAKERKYTNLLELCHAKAYCPGLHFREHLFYP